MTEQKNNHQDLDRLERALETWGESERRGMPPDLADRIARSASETVRGGGRPSVIARIGFGQSMPLRFAAGFALLIGAGVATAWLMNSQSTSPAADPPALAEREAEFEAWLVAIGSDPGAQGFDSSVAMDRTDFDPSDDVYSAFWSDDQEWPASFLEDLL